MLELFLPHETEDQFDFHSCPQSSSHLFGIDSSKWTFQHSYNSDQQRLPWICNQHCYYQKKINLFRRLTQLGPKKCLVYLHLPSMGNVSMRYEMQIKTTVKRSYFAVEPRIVYTRNRQPLARMPLAARERNFDGMSSYFTRTLNLHYKTAGCTCKL